MIEPDAVGYFAEMRTGLEKRDLGRQGEDLAAAFLRAQGYAIERRNYRCAYGEIDIVARDQETLVFVEVRTQSGAAFGGPLESVTLRKQRQIAKAATHYLVRHSWDERPLRFDVIGIAWKETGPQLLHVKAAFELLNSRG